MHRCMEKTLFSQTCWLSSKPGSISRNEHESPNMGEWPNQVLIKSIKKGTSTSTLKWCTMLSIDVRQDTKRELKSSIIELGKYNQVNMHSLYTYKNYQIYFDNQIYFGSECFLYFIISIYIFIYQHFSTFIILCIMQLSTLK